MKRIGIAASKISKGNGLFYNALVVVISCMVSFFLFVVVGATVVFALAIIAYVTNEAIPTHQRDWEQVRAMCLAALGVVIAVFNLMAIVINFRWPDKINRP